VQLLEKLVAEFPDVPDYRACLALGVRRIAGSLRHLGRSQDAEKAERESLAMWEKLLAEFPGFPAYRKQLAETHVQIGDLLKETGRPQEAEKALRQAVEIQEKLAAEFPGNEADSRTDLCESLGLLAGLLKDTGRRQKAENAYRQAVELSEKLVRDIPSVAWHRQMLSGHYRELASWLKGVGRHQVAEAVSRQAMDFYSKLYADFPNNPGYRASLSEGYAHLVELLVSRATLVEKDSKLSQAESGAAAQAYRVQASELLQDQARRGLPNPAAFLNNSAWRLATDPKPDHRQPALALELAKLAHQHAPDQGYIVNTLGIAYYRAGDWKAAIETLKDADELYQGQHFSSDAFFIAMASWRSGDKDAARKWYRAAARWMDKFAAGDTEQRGFRTEAAGLIGSIEQAAVAPQPSSEDDRQLYTLILDAWPEAAWAYLRRGQAYDSAGESQRAHADYRHAIDLYERAVQQRPKSWVPWAYRGSAYADLEQWDQAAGDLDKAAALGAAPAVWYQAALTRLAAHDLVGYRKTCAGILERLDKPEAAGPAHLGLWACAIGPDAAVDLARAVALAEKVVQGTPESAQDVGTLGALLYRGGWLDDAVRKLEEADQLAQTADKGASSPAYTWFFLAMAHHCLGHTAEAKKWFDKAREHTGKALTDHAAGTTRLPWNRRLTLTLCRQEAQEVLGLDTVPVPQLEPK
jgi:tetratricopeptide (TPR) repeat protein